MKDARVNRYSSGLNVLTSDNSRIVKWWCTTCHGRNAKVGKGHYIRPDEVAVVWEAHYKGTHHANQSRVAALIERVVEALP